MATSIFKLVMSAETETFTDTNPAVQKYFYKLEGTGSAVITIPSTSFQDDSGTAVASNLATVTATNGYYLLFVNGVLQQSSLFTVASTGESVTISQCSTVPLSAPITLVVNNFVPSSTSTTTVTT